MALTTEKALKTFKALLDTEQISTTDCFLFGSRAKGLATTESDWDFFVVLKNELGLEQKKSLKAKLHMQFHELFPAQSVDIVLKNYSEYEYEKERNCTLSYEVSRTGLAA